MKSIKKGLTDQTVYVFARAEDGSGYPMSAKSGLVYSGITAYYVRSRSGPVQITPVTLANPSAAHADGGFVEVALNMPGWYRFDVPDAAFAPGADSVLIVLNAALCVFAGVEIDLVDADSADLLLARQMVANDRQIDNSVNPPVETIYADDGSTPLKTLTHTETSVGIIKEDVSDPS